MSDAVMSTSMFVCVVFVKCLKHQWFRYYYTGLVIQHLWQTVYLFVAIWWGYHRQWYWVQAGFLVLHCLSNLMKVGSLLLIYYSLSVFDSPSIVAADAFLHGSQWNAGDRLLPPRDRTQTALKLAQLSSWRRRGSIRRCSSSQSRA